MTDDRITETTTGPVHHTTIVERRGGGGLLIGLALLLAVAIGAFFLFSQNRNEAVKTEAVRDAAKSVGTAAKKVGDAADTAAKKVAE